MFLFFVVVVFKYKFIYSLFIVWRKVHGTSFYIVLYVERETYGRYMNAAAMPMYNVCASYFIRKKKTKTKYFRRIAYKLHIASSEYAKFVFVHGIAFELFFLRLVLNISTGAVIVATFRCY